MKRTVLQATMLLVLLNLGGLLYFMLRSPRPSDATATATNANGAPIATMASAPGVYAVTGAVKELRADGSNVVIQHEAIPGFMVAMTMPFTARDPRQIASLQPGDKVTFRLLVTDEESWIDNVERVGNAAPAPAFDYEHARIVRDVEPLKPGDVMPDYVFTNQFEQPVRLSDFRGKAVGLTFIFTRCPLPDFCPRMLKNFAAAEDALQADPTAPKNRHWVVVTIDPAFDTPAILRAHARTYGAESEQWTFLTGALIDIDAITEQLGLVFRRQTPNSIPDHNLRTAVIDPDGRLRTVMVGNTWKPAELVQTVREAASSTAATPVDAKAE